MTRRQVLAQTRIAACDLFTRGLTGGPMDALFVSVARANPEIESEAIHRALADASDLVRWPVGVRR